MTAKARTTTTKPEPVPAGDPSGTPVEEVPATAPAPPAEPEPESTPEPTAEELDARASLRAVPPAEEFARAQRQDWPLSVGEAIAEVTRRIGAIPKDRRATGSGGGYAFRGIDDALSALHPILGDVGLVILPGQVVREVWETRATASGGTLNVARLLVRYTFMGPDGSVLPAEAWGEAGDSGDKATQKAHSQSYKTLVFQAFTIPTEASVADEPDATNTPGRPFTQDEVTRAERAHSAVISAETVEVLAGVRRRALELLPVPVTSGDRVAPLSVWIDLRRAELERGRPAGEPA